MPIIAKIDVTKIDKSKLHKGAKGTYLDAVLIDKQDQYGNDYMVVQGVSKEDRYAGIQGPIIGNAKIVGQPRQERQQRHAPPSQDHEDSDIPF